MPDRTADKKAHKAHLKSGRPIYKVTEIVTGYFHNSGHARKPARVPLIVVALVSGVFGAYFIVRSFASDSGPVSSGTVNSQPARMADSFVDSFGVNTHIHYTDRVYYTKWNEYVKPRLLELGVRNIRDGAYTGAGYNGDHFFYQRLRELGNTGIKASLITNINAPYSKTTDWSKLDDIQSWTGGMVDQFEGPNEPDIQGVADWAPQTRAAQQNLWNGVKSNPAISGIRVAGPSITWADNIDDIGNLSSWLDVGNLHPYAGGDKPSQNGLDQNLADHRQVAGGNKPMTATEAGYHNAINTSSNEGHKPTSEAATATYYPRMAFEYFNRGIAGFYGYEFIDGYENPSRSEREANFGLIRNDGSVKPSYTAMKNLITLLNDKGPAFTPGTLPYSINGGDSLTRKTLLQKRDGSYWLAVWQDSKVWDQDARTAIDPPNRPLTLNLPNQSAIQLYSPNQSTNALVNTTAQNFAFTASEQVSLIRISSPSAPQPPPPPPPSPPTPPPAPADTSPPDTTITNKPSSSSLDTTANFAFTASESGSTFQCQLDNIAYGVCTSPKAYTSLNTGTHNFKVRSVDRAGNMDTSPAAYSWSINAPPPPLPPADTAKPLVSITTPINNAVVSGVITAGANASDNIGVTKVEFYVDNAAATGAPRVTDTAAPYNYSIDTRTLPKGIHTITAKAYDAAGNSNVSTVTINVNNPDTTAPNAPANLKAAPASSTQVNLSWAAAADNGANQTGVTKYSVLRKDPNNSSYAVIAQTAATVYSDASRTAGTGYSYIVQAVDRAGNTSVNSGVASVTTPVVPDTTAPIVPAGLRAATASPTQINLSWSASSDSGGSGLAGYNVYRNGIKLNSTLLSAATKTYGDSKVSARTTYSYRIEAVDGAGNKSVQSNPVSVTTPAAAAPRKRGDLTGPLAKPDGKIDIQDISYLIRKYQKTTTTPYDSLADISGPKGTPDGKVDIYDLSYIIRNYEK